MNVNIKQGQTVEGTVVKVDPEGVYVDVGYKVEGFIPFDDLGMNPSDVMSSIKVGDKIRARVVKVTPENLKLSRRSLELSEMRARIKEAFKNKETIKAVVKDYNKGGLIVDLGPFRGFVPKSKVYSPDPSKLNLEELIGMELEFKILDIRPNENEVILSNKDAVLERIRNLKEQFWNDVYEGKVVEGIVRNIIDSGAFVRLMAVIDGFIPISELSWDRVSHPSEVLQVGQKVKAVVISFDRGKGRVTLSMKAMVPDPWRSVPEKYKPDQIVTGKVTKLGKKYALVRLDYGIEGVLPITELDEDHRKVGAEVTALVKEVNPSNRKITLSIKELERKKEEVEVKEYMAKLKAPKFTIGDKLGAQLPPLK